MNKSTKGALAAAGAALLLVGGAGSLAYWSASETVAGPGAITAGQLALTEPVCDGWAFDDSETTPDKPYVAASDLIVPGDVLSQNCTATVTATGEHMRATFGVTGAALSGALATAIVPGGDPAVDVDVTTAVGGGPVTEITEANDGDTVDISLTVTFDPAADNSTQTLAASLSDLTITLEQVHD